MYVYKFFKKKIQNVVLFISFNFIDNSKPLYSD